MIYLTIGILFVFFGLMAVGPLLREEQDCCEDGEKGEVDYRFALFVFLLALVVGAAILTIGPAVIFDYFDLVEDLGLSLVLLNPFGRLKQFLDEKYRGGANWLRPLKDGYLVDDKNVCYEEYIIGGKVYHVLPGEAAAWDEVETIEPIRRRARRQEEWA